ncbi:MAG: SGNH/GDSL hydrolase family protein [Verrucomicrobiota bacterium]
MKRFTLLAMVTPPPPHSTDSTKLPVSSTSLIAVVFILVISPLLRQATGETTDATQHPDLLQPNSRILFLGDSITQNGTYIAYIDAYLYTHFPNDAFDIVNLGLGSETASGDSEPDHPFPRPCVHTRLDKILAEVQPDVVFACYGMNDGIYYPLGEERFKNYRKGIRNLVKKCETAGATVVLLTPPPFDAPSKTLKGATLLPDGEEKYSYKEAYQDYDDVLAAYGDFIMKQDVAHAIDLHEPLTEYISRNRKADPDFSSGDGIHPNPAGHYIIAKTILEDLNAPNLENLPDYPDLNPSHPLAPALNAITDRRRNHSAAWREHIGHSRPKKTKAPPLPEAKEIAARQDTEIRKMIASPTQ